MKSKAKKVIWTVVIVIVALILVICVGGGVYLCNYALLPEEHGNDFEGDWAKTESRYPGITEWYNNLYSNGVIKDTSLVNDEGYKLCAQYVQASDPENAQGTAVVIHGYTDNGICFLNLVRMYRDSLNYNVMVPELSHHGHSEGREVQMGWQDRFDVEKFMDMAHNIWNDSMMVVHGVSMGGACTMMISGDELPEYVKAFVDDCGYSSVWDQFAHNLKDTFGLPTFPLLNAASTVCKLRFGWGFKEASAIKQLEKCDRPMLFIHGDKDDFVPTELGLKCFDAKTKGYKEIWIAPGSEHAMAYKDHPAEYTQRVRDFLAKVKSL